MMTNYFNAHVLGLALAAAPLLAPAPLARAQPGEPSISVRVSVADLDIALAYESCRAHPTSPLSGAKGVVGLMVVGPGHRGGLE